MSYQDITLEEMDQFLRKRRFYPVDLYFRRRPVKEWVYERKLPHHANHFVRVYTSIQRYGRNSDTARDVGKDAIRVQVIYRDNKGETLVSFPKRVNRVTTWANNLNDRLQEIASTLPEVKRDSRGEPMTLRQKKGNLFWGSRDYPAYKETRRYGSEQEDSKKGVAVMVHDGATSTYPKVWGTVYFEEVNDGITISYNIHGLYDGLHGFHIHQYGDLTDGCTSACAHFNPDNTTHGGLNTKIRHFGDLGNIESKDRLAQGSLFLAGGRLDSSKYGILGRMIIVHADQDDLGKGGDEESLKTGNAGKRLACGVIGLADPKDAGDKKAETVRECRECGKNEGVTTIQAGTYCYDCLPINLGAEDEWADEKLYHTRISEIHVIMLFDLLTNRGLDKQYKGVLTDYEPLDIMKSTTEYLTSTKETGGSLVKEYLITLEDDMRQAVDWEELAESCLEQIQYYKSDNYPIRTTRVFPNLLSRGIVEESDATRLVNELESQLRAILLHDRILASSPVVLFRDAINFGNI
jgi:Cu-Zn family superoxide dismutase